MVRKRAVCRRSKGQWARKTEAAARGRHRGKPGRVRAAGCVSENGYSPS